MGSFINIARFFFSFLFSVGIFKSQNEFKEYTIFYDFYSLQKKNDTFIVFVKSKDLELMSV